MKEKAGIAPSGAIPEFFACTFLIRLGWHWRTWISCPAAPYARGLRSK
jgi:hypothetical protein